ncbi:hypothetical protein CTI12_AA038880 [Artemisia annua]|uniref:Helitron helicase-like domain-containing protein n=1 Tax=Artemisia annua TaxID=35608 RepID=A0A2U1QEH8_ARTAN|nr:hypothetical protein CTI12_AA038880 [Artemisia annua]
MVNKQFPKVSKEQETNDLKNPSIETAAEKKVIPISDDELSFPTKTKRRRLMKNGSVVHNNVVNLSSDEENTKANKEVTYAKSPKYEKPDFDDSAPITFKRSTKKKMTTRSKPNKYAIIDEDTDDDIDNKNSIPEVSTDDTTDTQYTNNFIDEEAGNSPFGNKVVTQPIHNIVPVSENSEPQKRGRGRPRKTSIDSPTIPKTFKHQKHNQNTIPDTIHTPPTPLPGFGMALSTTQLRRYPLSDITSSTLTSTNTNLPTSSPTDPLLTTTTNVISEPVTQNDTPRINRGGRPRSSSKANPISRFKDTTPVHFDIEHNVNSTPESSSLQKGKSVADIPVFEMSDEDPEDEYGYMDRIEGISKDYFDHGDQTEQCIKCGALLWLAESMVGSTHSSKNEGFSICCGRGKIKLPVALKNPPPLLMKLLKGEHTKSKSFMEDIRRYNSMFAFTWMAGNQDKTVNSGRAPYCFRIQGKNNHVIGDLLPKVGESPKFRQLYIYDPPNEIENRINAVR